MLKLIQILQEVKFEARLAGDWQGKKLPKIDRLYHNTSWESMLSILKDNLTLKKGTNQTLSFSRSKKFWKDSQVRIIVDGNKLAKKYDVQPWDWGGDTNEYEEQIVGLHGKSQEYQDDDDLINQVDLSDFVIKVLVKPYKNEIRAFDPVNTWITNTISDLKKTPKEWKKGLEFFKIAGTPEEKQSFRGSYEFYKKFEKKYGLNHTTDEYRDILKKFPEYKKLKKTPPLEQVYRDLITGLQEKNVPYEVTDNFQANS